MAPDLNAVAAAESGNGKKWDYSNPGAQGYNIPDITLNDPTNRHLKILTIGAGVSGILLAYQIEKYCTNVTHTIYEKNADIGGTWLENRYPGCACDIPSHAYTYSFALNPDWPRFFSEAGDIWGYLDSVCRCFGLRRYLRFRTEVVGCWWEEGEGMWRVGLRESRDDGVVVREWEERCHLLLHGTGILNNFKWPKIPGLDSFKGKVIHTARWPKDYQAEQWKNDRVAVIGSGASSIQTVPRMQQTAKHLDVFVRTGVWFVEIAGQYGQNKEYSKEERDEFRKDPQKLAEHAKYIEDQVNGLWGAFYSDTVAQKQAQEFFSARMAEHIKDPRLLKGFTPKFGVGCRRITPGDPYMKAIQADNVDVHFTPVTSVKENAVVGEDGTEREVDTVVCATGFDVSYKPRFPIVGRDGIDLAQKWGDTPEGYLGLAVPGLPNFLTFIGPTWPVENGSVMGPLLTVSEYAIQTIHKMQYESIHSVSPKQDVTDAFNEHAQEWIKHTVWKEDCRAWYRDNDTGRVNAVWPGSSLHYQHVIRHPRWEDYEIKYSGATGLTGSDGRGAGITGPGGQGKAYGKNMFAWLGLGWSFESKANNELAAESAKLAEEAKAKEEAAQRAEGGAAEDRKEEEAERKEHEAKMKLIESRKEDFSPYLDSGMQDWRWLVAKEGMSADEAKELVIKRAGERAMLLKRREIERMMAGKEARGFNGTGFDLGML